jgi:gas vesicle protein
MSNQKFVAGLLLGAVAGAALALFLSSDKGKAIFADAKDTAEGLVDDIKDKYSTAEDEINSLIAKGKSFVDDLQQKAKDAIV